MCCIGGVVFNNTDLVFVHSLYIPGNDPDVFVEFYEPFCPIYNVI